VVDAASWAATDLKAQAIIASSVQQGLVAPQSLDAVVQRLVKVPRRRLIGETIKDVAGGSLSEYEVAFLRMCRRFHFPLPSRQVRRKDASGRWRYMDAEFDDYQLIAEIDGQQHMEALAWWADMERNNDVVVEDGKTLLRFAGFALRRQSHHVAGVLRKFFDQYPLPPHHI
jgi:very-short-patch-repair endonuclease